MNFGAATSAVRVRVRGGLYLLGASFAVSYLWLPFELLSAGPEYGRRFRFIALSWALTGLLWLVGALTLAMADSYYAFGKYVEADKLYLDFFKKVDKPSPALVSFYRDSAYKYAQMLLSLGKDKEGLEAYRRLFKVPLEENVERNVRADMAELGFLEWVQR